jgi:hypothetical protein
LKGEIHVPSNEQEKNYAFFQKQLPELLADPLKAGKYAIIHDESIKGLYDTFAAAYYAACSKLIKGFIVQQIVDESKIVNYLSPVVIS